MTPRQSKLTYLHSTFNSIINNKDLRYALILYLAEENITESAIGSNATSRNALYWLYNLNQPLYYA